MVDGSRKLRRPALNCGQSWLRITRLQKPFAADGAGMDGIGDAIIADPELDVIAQAAAGKDDISCAKALPANLGDWRRIMEFFLGPYRFGAELAELSAKEYAVSIDRSAAQLCRQGVGALIGKLAWRVPIKFFSTVTLVDWGERTVALATGEGVVTARAVIVTASTAVLA